MLSVLIFIILAICLFVNYKKTVIFILVFFTWISAFRLWWQDIMTFLGILIVVLFPLKMKTHNLNKFPFKIPFFLIILSTCLSAILASEHHYPSLIVFIIKQFLLIIISWTIYISNPKLTIKWFVHYAFIFGFIIAFYSLFETITKINPYLNFIYSLNAYTDNTLITEIRFGLKRSQGLFDVHVINGCMALSMFMILFYAKTNNLLKETKIASITLFLLICTIFFTGARSAILALLIILPSVMNKKYFRIRYVFPVLTILFFFMGTEYFSEIFYAITNSNDANIGSSEDMRTNQFALAIYFMEKSIVFGHGIGFIGEIMKMYPNEILGAESLWLPIMTEGGLLGIFCYIVLFIYSLRYFFIIKQYKLSLFILSFWVFNTLSSIHNCFPTQILMYSYLISEMNIIYKKQDLTS
mgnify:CR=1 FL=1